MEGGELLDCVNMAGVVLALVFAIGAVGGFGIGWRLPKRARKAEE